MALPGSVLITTKMPELAFFEPSLHCQLQEDKAMVEVVCFSWKCICYNARSNLMLEIRFLEF